MFLSEHLDGEITFYLYRKACVTDVYLCLDRTEELNEYQKQLAARVGVPQDNHTVYGITKNKKTVYIHFWDELVYFGLSIVEHGNHVTTQLPSEGNETS